jgi:hypothetical protein
LIAVRAAAVLLPCRHAAVLSLCRRVITAPSPCRRHAVATPSLRRRRAVTAPSPSSPAERPSRRGSGMLSLGKLTGMLIGMWNKYFTKE